MATLKISDLSVGDWVKYKGEPSRVLDCGMLVVSATSISFEPHLTVQAKHDIFESVNIEKIAPIPITAAILEKNGFESTTKPNVFTLTHGELQLYVSKELDGWHMSFVNFMERLCILQVIRKSYIHELQHALRLAGVDKEINL